jgi:hypothetical protein
MQREKSEAPSSRTTSSADTLGSREEQQPEARKYKDDKVKRARIIREIVEFVPPSFSFYFSPPDRSGS